MNILNIFQVVSYLEMANIWFDKNCRSIGWFFIKLQQKDIV